MKKKIHLVGVDARKKIMDGVDLLADAVKLTLGPAGRNFASGIRGGAIQISNDGVSLAKEIQGRDEFEDIGVRAVREAATKTNDKAGDGTTTAVTLTQAILKVMGFDTDNLGKASILPTVKQIEKESVEVVRMLNEMAVPVTSEEQLISVAKVSVEDDALAELIGRAQWTVGKDGTILADEHNETNDTVEYVYGIRMDNGFGTSRMANNQEKQALELKDVSVIVTGKIFNTAQAIKDLNKLFEALIAKGTTEVVLIGRAFDNTAIDLCVKNIQNYYAGKGGFPIYPINAPYTDMDEVMEDLAATLGGTYINGLNANMNNVMLSDVGFASKVFTKRYEGIITGKKRGEDERVDKLVDKRVENIKEKLKGEISPFEKRGLEARLSQLTAGTAIIKVGAETEQERKYKKDKVDDAVNTVKAALQEGVVPGGGTALMMIADRMEKKIREPNIDAVRDSALIAEALRAPYLQIVANAGGTLAIPEWVQDPLKVVRTALEKASSIARSLAMTEIAVNYEDENKYRELKQQVNLGDNDEG